MADSPSAAYDPFRGVKSVEKAGESISDILLQAKKAEAEMEKTRRSALGTGWLHHIIDARTKDNPNLAFTPLLDPVIAHAAALVEPHATDYVRMLKGINDTNLKALAPKVTRDAVVQLNPTTGKYDITRSSHGIERIYDEPLAGNKLQRHKKIVDRNSGESIHDEKIGEPFDRFNPNAYKGGGAANDKELNHLIENKNRVVTDFMKRFPEFDMRQGLVEGEFKNPFTKAAMSAKLLKGGKFDPKEREKMVAQGKKVDDANKGLKAVIDAINKYQEMAKNRGYDFEDVYDKAQQALDDEQANMPALNEDGSEPTPEGDGASAPAAAPARADTEYDYDPATKTYKPAGAR